jgi:hypothetical protein
MAIVPEKPASLLGSIDRLAHLLAATRGIARALDPDPVMSEHDRVNLYELTNLLVEHLETCLQDFSHLLAAKPEPEETQP